MRICHTQQAPIFAPNPLYEALPEEMDLRQLAATLKRDPLSEIGVSDPSTLNPDDRQRLLGRLTQLFVPTTTSLRVADAVHRMIREGYDRRSPTSALNRQHMAALAASQGSPRDAWPDFGGGVSAGMCVRGITGMGKSACIARALALFPQVVEHGPCAAAAWAYQKQLVWLRLDMPHDGSRGGLLSSICLALDGALGTDYAHEFKKMTVERAAGPVGLALARHYCGVLVIDEIQWLNAVKSPARHMTADFILRIMNWGIPIVLAGSAVGFGMLDANAQVARRITSVDDVTCDPPDDAQNRDWNERILPAMWRYVMMPEPSPLTDDLRAALYECTAGIPGIAANVISGSQRMAWRHGARHLTAEQIRDYFYRHSETRSIRALVQGFATRNPALLSGYDDISAETYARRWGVSMDAGAKRLRAAHPDQAGEGMPNQASIAAKDPYAPHRRTIKRRSAGKHDASSAASLVTGVPGGEEPAGLDRPQPS